jgi:hypothetical protein
LDNYLYNSPEAQQSREFKTAYKQFTGELWKIKSANPTMEMISCAEVAAHSLSYEYSRFTELVYYKWVSEYYAQQYAMTIPQSERMTGWFFDNLHIILGIGLGGILPVVLFVLWLNSFS